MADYNSSLPIRTEDAGDVIVKIADSLIPSQQVEITADREMSVISTPQPGVDIGDVTINNASGADAVNIQDGGNSITVDAVDLDIRDLAFATDKVDVSGSDVSVSGSVDVTATDLDIRPLNSATDSVTAVISSLPPGESVNDFKLASSIAAGASDDHDYLVPASSDFYLTQIEASGSGKAKMEVQIETAPASDIFETIFVQFNSSAETNMEIALKQPILIEEGVRVRINMLNRDLQAQNLYSTISGFLL